MNNLGHNLFGLFSNFSRMFSFFICSTYFHHFLVWSYIVMYTHHAESCEVTKPFSGDSGEQHGDHKCAHGKCLPSHNNTEITVDGRHITILTMYYLYNNYRQW